MMKKITFLVLILFLDFNNYGSSINILELQNKIKIELLDILSQKDNKIQVRWNSKDISIFSETLTRLHYLGINRKDIYALIDVECVSWNPWCSNNKNRNGSIDYGLTQQNSKYVQSRCKSVYARKCNKWELYTVRTSILLLEERMNECRNFSGDLKILCYNSTLLAHTGEGEYLNRWKQERLKYD